MCTFLHRTNGSIFGHMMYQPTDGRGVWVERRGNCFNWTVTRWLKRLSLSFWF